MGEQPNPWEVLPPQDATSRHRTYIPPISGGADYIFTLPEPKARGRRIVMTIFCLLYEKRDHHRGMVSSVVTGSLAEVCS
jgi:hypothetical protein